VRKRFPIKEPFNFHMWISHRCQLTFKFSWLHLNQWGLILDLSYKPKINKYKSLNINKTPYHIHSICLPKVRIFLSWLIFKTWFDIYSNQHVTEAYHFIIYSPSSWLSVNVWSLNMCIERWWPLSPGCCKKYKFLLSVLTHHWLQIA